MYKIHYIEFRFKKGSVFCYIKAIHVLIKKENLKKICSKSIRENN